MDKRLIDILAPAYLPCSGFAEVCHDMRWHATGGHVPRGFLGATGNLTEVELVLVFAEPGDPQQGEIHQGLDSALRAAWDYHNSAHDQFHKNARYILNLCFPDLNFGEQLTKVWMTESVLCSASVESGRVPRAVEHTCGQRYLLKQLELFPDAVVAALGAKAQSRMRALGFNRFIAASAVAPPEGNKPYARQSWNAIAEAVSRRRDQGSSPQQAVGRFNRNSTDASSRIHIKQTEPISSDLVGPYRVVDTSRLQATAQTDPGKWSIWKNIWESGSFEELQQRSPHEAFTRTNRRITWKSEARWALKCGWIEKIEFHVPTV